MQSRFRSKPISEINVVPYIDVMLVLLVIFMVTTPLITQGVDVDLPQAKTKVLAVEDKLPLVVVIAADGSLKLQDEHMLQSVTPKTLGTEIQAALLLDSNRKVLVSADVNTKYATVVSVMALLQQVGVSSVGLQTQE